MSGGFGDPGAISATSIASAPKVAFWIASFWGSADWPRRSRSCSGRSRVASDGRGVTLGDFSRVKDVRLATFDSILVLAGPRPLSSATLTPAVLAANEARQKLWSDVASRLATEARDKVQVEFALAHSSCMIANPDLVIDAGARDELLIVQQVFQLQGFGLTVVPDFSIPKGWKNGVHRVRVVKSNGEQLEADANFHIWHFNNPSAPLDRRWRVVISFPSLTKDDLPTGSRIQADLTIAAALVQGIC